MLVKITCPACNTDGGFSISDREYIGPYRCWKCRTMLKISMANNELLSCEQCTEEEGKRLVEIMEIKKKQHRGS